jgi:hypothetical protein
MNCRLLALQACLIHVATGLNVPSTIKTVSGVLGANVMVVTPG